MISLRSRLLRALLTVLVPVWLLLALGAYWLVMIEVDEIYEQQLRELAMPLLPLDAAQIAEAMSHRADPAHPGDDDDEMAVLIWDRKGAMTYRSEGAPVVAFPGEGADAAWTLNWHGARWRGHWYAQPERGRRLMVLRPLTERDELALALAVGLALPSLLAVGLMLPLGSWAIRLGLRPLENVGRQVASRRGHDLSLICDADVASEVAPLVKEINGLLGRLDKALAAERRFTADASHELRTPLAAVRANIEAALGSTDETSRGHALQRALAGLTQASGLTEQLLLLARLDHHAVAGDPAASPDAVPGWVPELDLRGLMRELSARHAVAALDKGVELALDAPDEPCLTSGQPAWLDIALGNVLSNAVKFTPGPGRIEVTLARRDDGLLIRVKDTGPGMDPGQAALIGQRFFRGRHDVSGAGLGLSIVARIVALHRGQLHAEADAGLTIAVVLPAAEGRRPHA